MAFTKEVGITESNEAKLLSIRRALTIWKVYEAKGLNRCHTPPFLQPKRVVTRLTAN